MSGLATGDDRMMIRMARIAGALWVLCVVAGMYAELFVRGPIIVRGDAVATAAHIVAAESTFRLGFVADLVGAMTYLGVSLLLYVLLIPAGRTLSLIALGFGITGCAIMGANLVNMFAPVVLLAGGGATPDATSLVPVFLRLHGVGYSVAMTLFAVHVGAIGYLILRSNFLPKLFGLLLLIEFACNLVSSIGGFLAIGWVKALGSYILLPGLPAEAGLALWLLIVGIDAKKRAAFVPAR